MIYSTNFEGTAPKKSWSGNLGFTLQYALIFPRGLWRASKRLAYTVSLKSPSIPFICPSMSEFFVFLCSRSFLADPLALFINVIMFHVSTYNTDEPSQVQSSLIMSAANCTVPWSIPAYPYFVLKSLHKARFCLYFVTTPSCLYN